MKLNDGFVKGQSDNLPVVDVFTICDFFNKNPQFISVETKGVKMQKSGRKDYGDNAIGYVQVKRIKHICTLKARITPEHKNRDKAYNMTLVINEEQKKVLYVECEGNCKAQLGGCKHSVALLMWVHRRSEEPAPTSVACYWKKAKLSRVGSELKFVCATDLWKGCQIILRDNEGFFLDSLTERCSGGVRGDTLLTKYYDGPPVCSELSVHLMLCDYFETASTATQCAEEFLQFSTARMDEAVCAAADSLTVGQSETALWHELRYGRITASRVHEAAQCKTPEGSLVEAILGASKVKDTAAMKRGRDLEPLVIKEVARLNNIQIASSGLLLMPQHPILGASPDGLSHDFVIEVKCPSTKQAMERYIKNDMVNIRYKAQMQLQMLFAKKKNALFCVADPTFEHSKIVYVLEEVFNKEYCDELVKKAEGFWKSAIFPLLKHNF